MLPTADTIARAVGCGRGTAATFEKPLRDACGLYEINNAPRLAAFFATIGHESASLARTVESMNYSAERLSAVWPARYPPALAKQHAHNPMAIANHVYGGRMGNKAPDDGWRFIGRGLLGVTGRANYEAVRGLLRERIKDVPDLLEQPSALAEPKWAAYSAAAYWADHDLNTLADAGEFERICRRVNGGDVGLTDRKARYERAKAALA
jgi:putative chitinase